MTDSDAAAASVGLAVGLTVPLAVLLVPSRNEVLSLFTPHLALDDAMIRPGER